MRRRPGLLAMLAALWLPLAAGCAMGAWTEPKPVASDSAPGTLLRQQAIPGAPDDAGAFRVLYRSVGLDGQPIAVSGLVIVPPGPPPPGGRPIVAWAHPTTGVVPRCAPSEAIFRFQQIQGLRDMVQHGFIVAATDYPGLGSAGTHPYLVGVSEARAVLDSVRAARALPDAGAGGDFAVWGHSQGGQAALFTGMLAAAYAPDLRLVGVAVPAPATDLAALLRADRDTPAGRNLTAMTLWSWSRVYGAPLDAVVAPAAMPAIDDLAGDCIESVYDVAVRGRVERRLEGGYLTVADLAAEEPWAGLIARNTPGTLPAGLPVFIAQGSADRVVPPRITEDYLRRLCAAGSPVEFVSLAGIGHAFAAMHSAREAVTWMADRLAGRPAPSGCR